jgi:hypothetical protein
MNKYLRLPAGGKGASIAPTAQSYRHATGTATTGTLVEPKASLWNRRADTLPATRPPHGAKTGRLKPSIAKGFGHDLDGPSGRFRRGPHSEALRESGVSLKARRSLPGPTLTRPVRQAPRYGQRPGATSGGEPPVDQRRLDRSPGSSGLGQRGPRPGAGRVHDVTEDRYNPSALRASSRAPGEGGKSRRDCVRFVVQPSVGRLRVARVVGLTQGPLPSVRMRATLRAS